MFAILDRGVNDHQIRWLCADVEDWWKGWCSEFLPLLNDPKSSGRAVRFALGEAQDLPVGVCTQLWLHGADSALLLAAEMEQPGAVVACLALLFGKGRPIAASSRHEHLASLCHHAASLALDSYLKLPVSTSDSEPARLSKREIECLQWAAVGKTSWETACILEVRERTVNFHLGNAFGKLKVNNKQAAVAQAILQGLILTAD